jgi:nicotinamide-nucleotide amidase
MNIEVIAIGDELLRGLIVNANGAFISRALCLQGLKVARHTTLPDHFDKLKEGLQEALQRATCVIATGGLGPTCDDCTRKIAAELFHSPFHFDKRVAEDLKRRYGQDLITLQDQATVPSHAEVILNTVGTAPGLIFHSAGKTLILLPGPPPEMQPMFTKDILPFLKRHFPQEHKEKIEQIHLCLLNENLIDPLLRSLKERYPQIDFGIYPGYGTVTLSLSAQDEKALQSAKKEITAAFPHKIFSSPQGTIEEALHLWFLENKKTLACAESCTGGMLAEKIVSNAGASEYFLGSFVTYADALKQSVLHVPESILKAHGAVSEEVVRAMLDGVFQISGADFAIAVSGIAGPAGGSTGKPVGTVFAAIGQRGHPPDVVRFQLTGSRQTIVLITTFRLLAALWRKVVHKIPCFQG